MQTVTVIPAHMHKHKHNITVDQVQCSNKKKEGTTWNSIREPDWKTQNMCIIKVGNRADNQRNSTGEQGCPLVVWGGIVLGCCDIIILLKWRSQTHGSPSHNAYNILYSWTICINKPVQSGIPSYANCASSTGWTTGIKIWIEQISNGIDCGICSWIILELHF